MSPETTPDTAPVHEDDEGETECPKCHQEFRTLVERVGPHGIRCEARWHIDHPEGDQFTAADWVEIEKGRLGHTLSLFSDWVTSQEVEHILGSQAYVDGYWNVYVMHGRTGEKRGVHTHSGRGRELSTAYLRLLHDLEVIS